MCIVLRPRLVETAGAASGVEGVFRPAGEAGGSHDKASGGHDKAAGGDAASVASGSGTGTGAWAISDSEMLAWRGAAVDACAQLRMDTRGVYSTAAASGWTFPDQLTREPRQSVRQAMKAAGCSMERWSEAAADTASGLALGGHWGGSGLQRRLA